MVLLQHKRIPSALNVNISVTIDTVLNSFLVLLEVVLLKLVPLVIVLGTLRHREVLGGDIKFLGLGIESFYNLSQSDIYVLFVIFFLEVNGVGAVLHDLEKDLVGGVQVTPTDSIVVSLLLERGHLVVVSEDHFGTVRVDHEKKVNCNSQRCDTSDESLLF